MAEPEGYKGKVTLQRIRLNSQGYDSSGRYFGCDLPLYWYQLDDALDELPVHEIGGYIRARNRTDAKARIRSLPRMSECSFYK